MSYEKQPWPAEILVQHRCIANESEKSNTLIKKMLFYAFEDRKRMTGIILELLPVLMSCFDEINIQVAKANAAHIEGRRPNWVVQSLKKGYTLTNNQGMAKIKRIIAAANNEEWDIVKELLEQLMSEVVELRKSLYEGKSPSYKSEEGENILPFRKTGTR